MARLRNIRVKLNLKNYKKIVRWFKDVNPGSLIDFCVNEKDQLILINNAGKKLILSEDDMGLLGYHQSISSNFMYLCIDQRYDQKGVVVTKDKRSSALERKMLDEWTYFVNTNFFKEYIWNKKDDISTLTDPIVKRIYISNSFEIYNSEILKKIESGQKWVPSKCFMMGDIGVGVCKAYSDTFILSFDIRVHAAEEDEKLLIEALSVTNREIYDLRKSLVNHLYKLIMNCSSYEKEYLEVPFINKKGYMDSFDRAKLLFEMYFSAKGIFEFDFVDDLYMFSEYRRENTSKGNAGNGRQNRKVYMSQLSEDLDIKPKDIGYPIVLPMSNAEINSLLGCYKDTVSRRTTDECDDSRKIYLCEDNIARAASYLSKNATELRQYFEGADVDDCFSDEYETLRKKVFFHEMGHMIFRKIIEQQYPEDRENTANWVACLNHLNEDTDKIRRITYSLCEHQTVKYRNPIKLPDFEKSNVDINTYIEYCKTINKLLER